MDSTHKTFRGKMEDLKQKSASYGKKTNAENKIDNQSFSYPHRNSTVRVSITHMKLYIEQN